RNIKTLSNFDPPATDEEIYFSSLQFVRKLSGFPNPGMAIQPAFDRAVDKVSRAARELIDSLVTSAPPRDRDIEAAKARARSAPRYPGGQVVFGKRHRDQPAANACRLRHHEREVQSRADRVRRGLSQRPRHR